MNPWVASVVPLTSGGARRAVARFGASPRTRAVPVLPANAYGTDKWLAARRGMVGASEMAAVVGVSPWASPFSLWWSKQEGWEFQQTFAMRLGHELEPLIARLFAESRPDVLVCASKASLWRSATVPWLGCTPDFLAVAGDDTAHGHCHIEPVEAKSDEGGRGWGRPGTGEVPDHHRIQVLQQCEVFGAPRGHLVRMAGKRFSAYVVEYDKEARSEMAGWVAQGDAFVDSLTTGAAPDLDGHRATTDALTRLQPAVDDTADALIPDDLAAEYERLAQAARDVKADMRLAQNQIREHMGDAKFGLVASTGRRFIDRRVYKRREYVVASTVVDALYPVPARKAPSQPSQEATR